jgi:hypothetical protein
MRKNNNVEIRLLYDAPTLERFEEARQRELARLNIRVSTILGNVSHTPEDVKLLEQDTPQQRTTDMDIVRRWTGNSERYGGGSKKLA